MASIMFTVLGPAWLKGDRRRLPDLQRRRQGCAAVPSPSQSWLALVTLSHGSFRSLSPSAWFGGLGSGTSLTESRTDGEADRRRRDGDDAMAAVEPSTPARISFLSSFPQPQPNLSLSVQFSLKGFVCVCCYFGGEERDFSCCLCGGKNGTGSGNGSLG
ncbi:uncharacterized protein DS421_18g623640 [Arachis hypogaea]|nr:uncharacterized protein DS421_18g623640 [Arachis hypogaea]